MASRVLGKTPNIQALTKPTPQRPVKLPLQAFYEEVNKDLPELIANYPDGIYIMHMVEWYGESISRCTRVMQMLNANKEVVVQQAASRAWYMLPANHYVWARAFTELTDLQRKCVLLVMRLIREADASQLRTNISQLARLLEASYGGVRACIIRLEQLGYIIVRNPSLRGRQDQMILAVGPKADPKITLE